MDIKRFKQRIEIYLNQDNYALFIETITKADINLQNYVLYLNTIKEAMKNKLLEQDPFEISSSIKLEEVYGFRTKEKTYIEILPDLHNAILVIFRKKLNLNSIKYEDEEKVKEIEKNLENFNERFM